MFLWFLWVPDLKRLWAQRGFKWQQERGKAMQLVAKAGWLSMKTRGVWRKRAKKN